MLKCSDASTKKGIMSESFGRLENFKVGDVVLWSNLDGKMTGVISDLQYAFKGGRDVGVATVFCFENQKKHEVLAVNLKILTKNGSGEAKTN